MERLTEVYGSGANIIDCKNLLCREVCKKYSCDDCPIQRAIDRLSDYEDLGLTAFKIQKLIEQLREYQSLEEQGLLLKLPCKVGDKLYVPESTWKRVFEVYVISISKDKENLWVRCGNGLMYIWGEEVFATKEEAEAKLKELENE